MSARTPPHQPEKRSLWKNSNKHRTPRGHSFPKAAFSPCSGSPPAPWSAKLGVSVPTADGGSPAFVGPSCPPHTPFLRQQREGQKPQVSCATVPLRPSPAPYCPWRSNTNCSQGPRHRCAAFYTWRPGLGMEERGTRPDFRALAQLATEAAPGLRWSEREEVGHGARGGRGTPLEGKGRPRVSRHTPRCHSIPAGKLRSLSPRTEPRSCPGDS